MDRDKSEWLIVPLILAVILVAQAVAQDEPERKPSLFQRLSRLALGPADAPLDKPYEPKGELKQVDISEKVNKKLSDGTNRVEGNTLKSLPKGKKEFAGVTFNIIDGVIQLASEDRPQWPEKIEGIPVDSRFARLYVLHATQTGPTGVKDKTLIGRYVVHYEDDTQETIPIVYGEDVRDWWNTDGSKKLKRGKVAWVGTNAAAKQHNVTLRLFVSKWDNPKPDTKVTTIDYVSEVAGEAGPFCISMTMEQANPKD